MCCQIFSQVSVPRTLKGWESAALSNHLLIIRLWYSDSDSLNSIWRFAVHFKRDPNIIILLHLPSHSLNPWYTLYLACTWKCTSHSYDILCLTCGSSTRINNKVIHKCNYGSNVGVFYQAPIRLEKYQRCDGFKCYQCKTTNNIVFSVSTILPLRRVWKRLFIYMTG